MKGSDGLGGSPSDSAPSSPSLSSSPSPSPSPSSYSHVPFSSENSVPASPEGRGGEEEEEIEEAEEVEEEVEEEGEEEEEEEEEGQVVTAVVLDDDEEGHRGGSDDEGLQSFGEDPARPWRGGRKRRRVATTMFRVHLHNQGESFFILSSLLQPIREPGTPSRKSLARGGRPGSRSGSRSPSPSPSPSPRSPPRGFRGEELPSEILCEIFRYLPVPTLIRVAAVCKTWRALSLSSSLFSLAALKPARKEVSLQMLSSGLARGPLVLDLKGIKISAGGTPVPPSLSLALPPLLGGRSTQKLRCSQAAICSDAFRLMASSCPQLVALDLSFSNITDDDLIAFCELCPSIEFLNLTQTAITSRSLAVLARTLTLSLLNISWCHHIDDAGLLALKPIARHFAHLNLSGGHQFSSEAVGELLRSCEELRVLKINDCNQIEPSLTPQLSRCKELRRLEICRVWKYSHEDLLTLLSSLPSLCQFAAVGFPGFSAEQLRSLYPNLRQVATDVSFPVIDFIGHDEAIFA